MGTFLFLLCCGAAGGFLFQWANVPGGAMTGAMLAVILVKWMGTLPASPAPQFCQFLVYVCLGVVVGDMFKPEMIAVLRQSWWVVLLSTGIILLAGVLTTFLVIRFGHLEPVSAYLATSPGGLNAVVGLASDMGPDAPLVLAYQMVRLYAILLSVPLVAKWLMDHFSH